MIKRMDQKQVRWKESGDQLECCSNVWEKNNKEPNEGLGSEDEVEKMQSQLFKS